MNVPQSTVVCMVFFGAGVWDLRISGVRRSLLQIKQGVSGVLCFYKARDHWRDVRFTLSARHGAESASVDPCSVAHSSVHCARDRPAGLTAHWLSHPFVRLRPLTPLSSSFRFLVSLLVSYHAYADSLALLVFTTNELTNGSGCLLAAWFLWSKLKRLCSFDVLALISRVSSLSWWFVLRLISYLRDTLACGPMRRGSHGLKRHSIFS